MSTFPWYRLVRMRDTEWSGHHRRQSLTDAVKQKNVEDLKKELEQARIDNDLTPSILANVLVLCCRHNKEACARMVLKDFQADIKTHTGPHRTTALMAARSTEMVELLLENVDDKSAALEARDVIGRTPLIRVIVEQDLKEQFTDQVVIALIGKGAKVDAADVSGISALMHALITDKPVVATTLLKKGAAHGSLDGQRRNALMVAAWRNHIELFNTLLVDRKSDVHAVDERGRSVLHHICQDVKRAGRSQSGQKHPEDDLIATIILGTDLDINGLDESGRTPLHYASEHNNEHLVEKLLTCGKKVDINAADKDKWTPLHFAIDKRNIGIARFLIQHGSNVDLPTNQGWTALHVASRAKESIEFIPLLLNKKEAALRLDRENIQSPLADYINAGAIDQKTALHLAAEADNVSIVAFLLEQAADNSHIDVALQDTNGNTAMFNAAKCGNKRIVEMLAHFTYAALTKPALDASRCFMAEVVDFGPSDGAINIKSHVKRKVHHLITGEERVTPKEFTDQNEGRSESTGFRWIHLPSNNLAWCQEILVRRFVEREGADPETFKTLQMSFNNEHVGTKPHSRYMRPVCRLVPRSRLSQDTAPVTSPSKGFLATTRLLGSAFDPQTPAQNDAAEESRQTRQLDASPIPKHRPPSDAAPRGRQPDRLDTNVSAPSFDSQSRHRAASGANQSASAVTPVDIDASPGPSNIGRHETYMGRNKGYSMFMFMPYVHYERTGALHRMQGEIAKALDPKHEPPRVVVKDHVSGQPAEAPFNQTNRRPTLMEDRQDADKKLVGAHVYQGNASVHIRRTLDQSFYRTIDTKFRDQDQVILRYQREHKPAPHKDGLKLLMVDQLWMWIVEGELLITSFPKRWEQSDKDSDDIFKTLLGEMRMPAHEHISNIYELALFIAGHCAGMSDIHSSRPGETLFLDMFDAAIGNVTEAETELFEKFEAASAEASQWLEDSRKIPGIGSSKLKNNEIDENFDVDGAPYNADAPRESLLEWSPEPPFIHTLLDIKGETKLTKEIKDIKDELGMLHNIFTQQQQVCDEAHKRMTDALHPRKETPSYHNGLEKVYQDLNRRVQNPLKDIMRMQDQAEQNYVAIKDLLDLKQKYANAMQAADVARQSQTILVFTIVTVIFLPLSFLAAFFALELDVFPHDEDGNIDMPLSYVLKYVVGVGLGVGLPFVLVALMLKKFRWLVKEWRKRFHHFRTQNGKRKKDKKRKREERQRRNEEERARIREENDRGAAATGVNECTAGIPSTETSAKARGGIVQRLRQPFGGQSQNGQNPDVERTGLNGTI